MNTASIFDTILFGQLYVGNDFAARLPVPLKKLAELKMRKEQIAELQKANAGKDEIIISKITDVG